MLTSYEFLSAYMRARFGGDERGDSVLEYALLVALLAIMVTVGLSCLGPGPGSEVGK